MTLPKNFVPAIYKDPGVERYRGNPFIEALPQIATIKETRKALQGNVAFNPADIFSKDRERPHEIASLLDDFFQPIGNHLQLEEKISIMIRSGYVGRNIADGSMNTQLQNGYERIMTGDLDSYRFEGSDSTAKSLSLIGVSGCGKSSTLSRLLSMYPAAIYHEKYNAIQLPYLKVECPFNGSLKSLCLNFFRQLDQVRNSGYEKKFTAQRHNTETLLTLMAQHANTNAIGILVIDEIQRLTRKRNAGREEMMEFFVQLVNVIGIPVILVGTPKARPIFEIELQSGRRGAGFGSLVWEPMKNSPPRIDSNTGKDKPSEWIAFTNKLWQYQWLRKKDEVLSEELRDCWYDLSQGVLDIAVKLFVLAQLRAIATKRECITVKLLQQVYHDEFKPVHKMLAALRSNDPQKIADFSDLRLHDIDKRLLELNRRIEQSQDEEKITTERLGGNEQALRLFHLLEAMDCQSDLLIPLIEKAFNDHPSLSVRELMPVVLAWYEETQKPTTAPSKPKAKVIKPKQWLELEKQSLRYQYALCEGQEFYKHLKSNNMIFNVEAWLSK